MLKGAGQTLHPLGAIKPLGKGRVDRSRIPSQSKGCRGDPLQSKGRWGRIVLVYNAPNRGALRGERPSLNCSAQAGRFPSRCPMVLVRRAENTKYQIPKKST